MWAAYSFINFIHFDVSLLIWCAIALSTPRIQFLTVLNGLVVLTVLIIFIVHICCLYIFVCIDCIVCIDCVNCVGCVDRIAGQRWTKLECLYLMCHCQRCHCPHVAYFAFTCIFYMFAIKRVFAAPPGKTSGFADLLLKRRPPRHDQRSEQCSTRSKFWIGSSLHEGSAGCARAALVSLVTQ